MCVCAHPLGFSESSLMRLRSHIQRHLDAPAPGGSRTAAIVSVSFRRRNTLRNLPFALFLVFLHALRERGQ